MGSEMAGTIESVGKDVTRFRVGDEVFGFPGGAMGCHAQYRTMPEDGRIVSIATSLSLTGRPGFGSSVSIWLGPPASHNRITLLPWALPLPSS